MKPRIGLTASHAYGDDGGLHPDVAPYVRAIERFGGEAVPLANDVASVDDVCARLDGLVLSGGVDVDPQRYGGDPQHSRSQRGRYRAERDACEIALVRHARATALPTLGICRGMQIANVAFGGTLVEDLVDAHGGAMAIDHRQTDAAGVERTDYAPGHLVTVDSGSALARLVGRTTLATNSMHHQALRRLGDGLVAVARTPDGVIEAADANFAHPFFFLVQWHPEELDDDVGAALFGGLIAAGAVRRAARRTTAV